MTEDGTMHARLECFPFAGTPSVLGDRLERWKTKVKVDHKTFQEIEQSQLEDRMRNKQLAKHSDPYGGRLKKEIMTEQRKQKMQSRLSLRAQNLLAQRKHNSQLRKGGFGIVTIPPRNDEISLAMQAIRREQEKREAQGQAIQIDTDSATEQLMEDLFGNDKKKKKKKRKRKVKRKKNKRKHKCKRKGSSSDSDSSSSSSSSSSSEVVEVRPRKKIRTNRYVASPSFSSRQIKVGKSRKRKPTFVEDISSF